MFPNIQLYVQNIFNFYSINTLMYNKSNSMRAQPPPLTLPEMILPPHHHLLKRRIGVVR